MTGALTLIFGASIDFLCFDGDGDDVKIGAWTVRIYDFIGLNRGSSLLELVLRQAEHAGQSLKIRVQVRSFDAMCHMIGAGLGIGVLPLAACQAQVSSLGLKAAIALEEPWARRQLVLASVAAEKLSAPARLLRDHLVRRSV